MKPNNDRFRHLSSMVLLIVVSLEPAATLWAKAQENTTQPPGHAIATLQPTYGKLPLSFEANQGQWHSDVQFVTRGGGHTLFLTPNEAVLSVRTAVVKDERNRDRFTQHKPFDSHSPTSQSVVRMTFAGADAKAEMVGLEPLPGIVNYFIGDDPTKWRTNIPTYQKVEYKNLYAGIDLVYYGNQGQLEYDLVVTPGADPTQIMLAFDGTEQITVDEQGDLLLTLQQFPTERAEGLAPTLHLHKPVVYQQDEQGEKHLLTGTYVFKPATDHKAVALHSKETPLVAFHVAPYDASKPLIIDPVLSWATYLGRSGDDRGMGIAIDIAGNAYVTGSTDAPGSSFPGTDGSLIQSTLSGVYDAYVTKLNATGTAIIYSTYLGGSGLEEGRSITLDAAGNAYVTGFTDSSNFPGTADSLIQSMYGGGGSDVFVTKLNTSGTALLYSTYLGGSLEEIGWGVAVDQAGHAYVTGSTNSSDFPGTAGSPIQKTYGGGDSDAFVTKINATGTALVYSTYWGGSGNGVEEGRGIAVDVEGHAYVTGGTHSFDFPVTRGNLIQSTYGGERDGYVTKLNPTGTAIVYSTYLGGSDFDSGYGIAADSAGNAYVTGETRSSGFPGTAGSLIQNTIGGGASSSADSDAFITKLNAAGTAILYSTYLGGSGFDQGIGIVVSAAGNAYVTGETGSSNFPGTANSPIQKLYGGGNADAFVTNLNAAGTAIVYSTYLGGNGGDFVSKIALDTAGSIYVTGITDTSGSGFLGTSMSPVQNTYGGGVFDAFVAKITSSLPFAAFDARVKIDVEDRRHHGGFKSHHRPHHDDAEGRHHERQDNDEFDLTATFTLGPGSNGIDPLTDPVIVQVGTFSTAIPPGSFKQHKGRFVFEGTINGVHLEAVLRSLILGNDYELKVEGHGADLTGTTNPVTVSVSIGDDNGSKAITAKIK